jgi:hypothetical protein
MHQIYYVRQSRSRGWRVRFTSRLIDWYTGTRDHAPVIGNRPTEARQRHSSRQTFSFQSNIDRRTFLFAIVPMMQDTLALGVLLVQPRRKDGEHCQQRGTRTVCVRRSGAIQEVNFKLRDCLCFFAVTNRRYNSLRIAKTNEATRVDDCAFWRCSGCESKPKVVPV